MKFWSIVVLKNSQILHFMNFFSLLLKILIYGAVKPKSRISDISRRNKNLANLNRSKVVQIKALKVTSKKNQDVIAV